MSKMKELYTACMLNGVDPTTVVESELNIIADLWKYFNNVEHAVEAYVEGYTAEELLSKGDFQPYWVYLIWVKK